MKGLQALIIMLVSVDDDGGNGSAARCGSSHERERLGSIHLCPWRLLKLKAIRRDGVYEVAKGEV